MTEKEINKILEDEYKKFYTAKWALEPVMPKGIIVLFRKAIMLLPASAHNLATERVREIASRADNELTFIEVGTVVNILLLCPLEKLHKTFAAAVDYYEILLNIRYNYNVALKAMEAKMEAKKHSLMNLGGVNRKHIVQPGQGKGMAIVK